MKHIWYMQLVPHLVDQQGSIGDAVNLLSIKYEMAL